MGIGGERDKEERIGKERRKVSCVLQDCVKLVVS